MENKDDFFILKSITTASLYNATLIVILTYGPAYFFKSNGFSLIEVSFIPLLLGFIFIAVSSIIVSVFLIKYNNFCTETGNIPIKNIYYIFGIILISLSIIFIIDVFIHACIDKTLSEEYADKLLQVAIEYKQPVNDIKGLSNLPFLIQNWTIGLIGVLLGTIFSWIFYLRYKKKQ